MTMTRGASRLRAATEHVKVDDTAEIPMLAEKKQGEAGSNGRVASKGRVLLADEAHRRPRC